MLARFCLVSNESTNKSNKLCIDRYVWTLMISDFDWNRVCTGLWVNYKPDCSTQTKRGEGKSQNLGYVIYGSPIACYYGRRAKKVSNQRRQIGIGYVRGADGGRDGRRGRDSLPARRAIGAAPRLTPERAFALSLLLLLLLCLLLRSTRGQVRPTRWLESWWAKGSGTTVGQTA